MFSVIFGEGTTNDAVGIILFGTVVEYAKPGVEFSGTMPLRIFGRFVELTIVSVLVGVVIGFLSAIVYKKLRIITMNPIMESVILFSLAYVSYCVSEVLECSGIISLLTCGVIMGHYTWYNLSPQSK